MSDLTGRPSSIKPLLNGGSAVVNGIQGRVISENPLTGEVTISLDGARVSYD